MKKLNRIATEAPSCLNQYGQQNTWNDVNADDRKAIRSSLADMQSSLCAYCEVEVEVGLKTEKPNCHIEHFAPKSKFPNDTFTWSNLFLSCGADTHCGHYKDSPQNNTTYQPKELIKPDADDPNDFLQFCNLGKVKPKPNLNKKDKDRAELTIQVFNLNEIELVEKRKNMIKTYVGCIAKSSNPEDNYEAVMSSLKENPNISYYTAIMQCMV